MTDQDPNPRVRASAVKQSLRAGRLGAPELRALIADAPADLRRVIYRHADGDALIDEVRRLWGDREAARLLPRCGPETVARLRPILARPTRPFVPPAPLPVPPISDLAEALALLESHPADRVATLTALTRNARLITAAAVPTLTRIRAEAESDEEGTAWRRLETAVLRRHVTDVDLFSWALPGYLIPGGPAGAGWYGRLNHGLTRTGEAELLEPLCTWASADPVRLLTVAHALGRRAWRLPALQRMLEDVIRRERTPWLPGRAARYWLADPVTRAERVERMLAWDRSNVAIDEVWDAICTRRPDLLDLVLTRRRPRGRYLTDRSGEWVPFRVRHAERWRPDQRAAFVRTMARVVARRRHPIYSARALSMAAQAGGRDLILRYLDDRDPRVADAALRALAHLPDELPLLLSYAGTPRGGTAMSAAARSIRSARPSTLPALLSPVVRGDADPAVRREAARLLALHGPRTSTVLG